MKTRNKATEFTRKRYNRLARFYDAFEFLIERGKFASWRKRLRERIRGPLVLEAGLGTGKNILYYPAGVRVIGIDNSPRMLHQARKKFVKNKSNPEIVEMDIQALGFPDNVFDTVFATFVFRSRPGPWTAGITKGLEARGPASAYGAYAAGQSFLGADL